MKRIVELVISPKESCRLFDDSVTRIYIEDEGAGEFICITQCFDDEQTIRLENGEIDLLIESLREMKNLISEETI